MPDLERLIGFAWDHGNVSKSEAKHGVSWHEAEELFANAPLLISDDIGHSARERRFHAMGKTNAGRLLFAAFTLRQNDTLIRIISVRDMKTGERLRYEEEA